MQRVEKRLATWSETTIAASFFGDPCHMDRSHDTETQSRIGVWPSYMPERSTVTTVEALFAATARLLG